MRREPSCSWVQDRIPAFSMCDPSLTQKEWDSISRHVERCEACARVLDEMEDTLAAMAEHLYPESKLPPFDSVSVAQEILTRVQRAQLHLKCTREVAVLPFPAGSGRQAAVFPRRRRFAAIAALAAAALMMVTLPVLAYVCLRVALLSLESSEPVAIPSDEPANVLERIPAMPYAAKGGLLTQAKTPIPTATPSGINGLDELLASLTDATATRSEIEAMLPDSDEEYEAWARRQYPHIMWLYDVLTEEQGLPNSWSGSSVGRTESPDSPAGHLIKFGSDADGNPTITLRETESNFVMLTVVLAGGAAVEPREIIATDDAGMSPRSARIYLDSAKLPWDGIPVNVPEWGKLMYADTPESERPTGWRALLIYSGEIFRFDWPKGLEQPNCIPKNEAIRRAANVAVGGWAVSNLNEQPDSRHGSAYDSASSSAVASTYVRSIAGDVPTLVSTVLYILISEQFVESPRPSVSSSSVSSLLNELMNTPGSDCSLESLSERLTSALRDRSARLREILEAIESEERIVK